MRSGLRTVIPVLCLALWWSGMTAGAWRFPVASPLEAANPFLRKPFSGSYPITSYFDHHFPNMDWDDQVVINSGLQANAIDGIIDRGPIFQGGYWAPDLNEHIYYDGHDAWDYGTGAGKTILAAADGKVIFAGEIESGCAVPAKMVLIEHAAGYQTLYLHLDEVATNPGPVFKGQPIGISGSTGCVTGPHLHFAVRHNGYDTDPYGWQGPYPDPLLAYSGEQSIWLWEEEGPAPPDGHLISPLRASSINGPVTVTVEAEDPTQNIAAAIFYAWHDDDWHEIGLDSDGRDGWSVLWDPAEEDNEVEDQNDVWFHAWLCDDEGRCNTGLDIVTAVTLDRAPPLGRIVFPSSGATVNDKAAISFEGRDERSGTAHVEFYAGYGNIWRQIGVDDSRQNGWSAVWDASEVQPQEDVAFMARVCDRAGNCNHHVETVTGVRLDKDMPGGAIVWPPADWATAEDVITVTLESRGDPARVVFLAHYDGEWQEIGTDTEGQNNERSLWSVVWDVSKIRDQNDLRFCARVYDQAGRYNDALAVVGGVILDTTPPAGSIASPRHGAFVNGDQVVRAQASDRGSGVGRVVLYAGYDDAWHEIGTDTDGQDGWGANWDVSGIQDQEDVWFKADLYDRLGHYACTETMTGVTLDTTPPEGRFISPPPKAAVQGPITLALEASDDLSGLDRVIFYAAYGGRWHGLGADASAEGGWSLVWDWTQAAPQEEVVFTAWVYDRAGNHTQIELLTGVRPGELTTNLFPPFTARTILFWLP